MAPLTVKLLTPRERGSDTERACRRHLQQQGLKLLEANYRCRCGEIDLVMLDHDTVVFVEVRFRRSNAYGGALESVTGAKQEKLRRAAEHFLQRHPDASNARFDVVAVSQNGQNSRAPYSFDWIKNAF